SLMQPDRVALDPRRYVRSSRARRRRRRLRGQRAGRGRELRAVDGVHARRRADRVRPRTRARGARLRLRRALLRLDLPRARDAVLDRAVEPRRAAAAGLTSPCGRAFVIASRSSDPASLLADAELVHPVLEDPACRAEALRGAGLVELRLVQRFLDDA